MKDDSRQYVRTFAQDLLDVWCLCGETAGDTDTYGTCLASRSSASCESKDVVGTKKTGDLQRSNHTLSIARVFAEAEQGQARTIACCMTYKYCASGTLLIRIWVTGTSFGFEGCESVVIAASSSATTCSDGDLSCSAGAVVASSVASSYA